VAAKENLARQCHKVRNPFAPLGHEYEDLAAVHEEEMAAKENLARQCHKVRKPFFCSGTSTRVWRQCTRRRWLPRRTSPASVTRLENSLFRFPALIQIYLGLYCTVSQDSQKTKKNTKRGIFSWLKKPDRTGSSDNRKLKIKKSCIIFICHLCSFLLNKI
jgi:hypothetical protein